MPISPTFVGRTCKHCPMPTKVECSCLTVVSPTWAIIQKTLPSKVKYHPKRSCIFFPIKQHQFSLTPRALLCTGPWSNNCTFPLKYRSLNGQRSCSIFTGRSSQEPKLKAHAFDRQTDDRLDYSISGNKSYVCLLSFFTLSMFPRFMFKCIKFFLKTTKEITSPCSMDIN